MPGSNPGPLHGSHSGQPCYPPPPTSAPSGHRSWAPGSISSYADSESSTAPTSPGLALSRPGSRPGEHPAHSPGHPSFHHAALAPVPCYPSPATSLDAADPAGHPSEATSAAQEKARKKRDHKVKEHRRRREQSWLDDRAYFRLPAWYRALVEHPPPDPASAAADPRHPRVSASRTNRGTPAKNAHAVAANGWLLLSERLAARRVEAGIDVEPAERERLAWACILEVEREVAEAGRNGFVTESEPGEGGGAAGRGPRRAAPKRSREKGASAVRKEQRQGSSAAAHGGSGRNAWPRRA